MLRSRLALAKLVHVFHLTLQYLANDAKYKIYNLEETTHLKLDGHDTPKGQGHDPKIFPVHISTAMRKANGVN